MIFSQRVGQPPRLGEEDEVIKGVLERKHQVEEEIENGTRVRFRTREEIDEMKGTNKNRHRNTWYLRGGATSVLFVPATPGSQLCKKVREGIKDMKCLDGGVTKVVEQGGVSVMAGLSKADPGRKLECPYGQIGEKCWVEKGVHCWRSRVIYQLECLLCGYQ